MPKRSNLFQDVVALVHRHLADDAVTEESAMLRHGLTGQLREVDVTVSQRIAGHPVIVSIEATTASRPADVQWVEQLVGKHEHLPTNKLILVANGGFTPQARALALARGAMPLEALEDKDTEQQVLSGLNSLWAKSYELRSEHVRLRVASPGGVVRTVHNPPVDLDVVKPDGSLLCTIQACVVGLLNASSDRANDAFDMRNVSADAEGRFTYDVEAPTAIVEGGDTRFGLLWQLGDGTHQVHLIDHLHVEGQATIVVRELPLERLRLGDSSVAYGETEILGRASVLVVTGSPSGPIATVRTREPGDAEPMDFPIAWLSNEDGQDEATPTA